MRFKKRLALLAVVAVMGLLFGGCGWGFGDVCSSCDSDADCDPGLTCDSFIGGDVCAYPETEECVHYTSY